MNEEMTKNKTQYNTNNITTQQKQLNSSIYILNNFYLFIYS